LTAPADVCADAPAGVPAGVPATSEAERDDLRAVVRAFARDRSPLTEVRRVSATETGFDPALWSATGSQLGLPGLLVPAEFGGSG
jgi:alkylation response protein AidB-like acyl-CoA dehydrogenase